MVKTCKEVTGELDIGSADALNHAGEPTVAEEVVAYDAALGELTSDVDGRLRAVEESVVFDEHEFATATSLRTSIGISGGQWCISKL